MSITTTTNTTSINTIPIITIPIITIPIITITTTTLLACEASHRLGLRIQVQPWSSWQ